jgi:hypothetical protein
MIRLPALLSATVLLLPLPTAPGVARPDADGPAAAGIALADLFPGARFDAEIPSPVASLGVEPGERPLRPDEITRYFETLAAASPRATLRTYAHSHEGRPLVYLAVAEPDTIARLDAFRAEHARRTHPAAAPTGDAPDRLADAKAVAWLAYAIHGDELSSSDAAVALAYRLVAGEDEWAQRIRRELVVLIDPLQNPDGRARYLALTEAFAHREPNPSRDDLSHVTVWPWGRGNHYLFDLNRDWLTMVQPESERAAVIASWNPQLVVDSHEMGADSTYLFSPPRHPFNPHLPPSNARWREMFGADQAAALDERGYPYFTREWNEEFFPGYGSSWASYHGAVGILYEMSRTTGTLVRKRSGELRTYPQAVEHQVASSLANLSTLLAHHEAILADFVADRRAAIEAARTAEQPGGWVLPEADHPARTRRLVDVLRRQGVSVRRAEGDVGAEGLRDLRTGDAVPAAELPRVNWLVPLDQPAGRLARVLLDPHVPMGAAFLSEEREHLERQEGTRLYETTAWSLPLAYDVAAYWTARGLPEVGDEEAAPAAPAGELVPAAGDGPVQAYLVNGTGDGALVLLAELLERNLAVRVADEAFTIGGRSYPRGSLVVPREGNPDDLDRQLAELARRHAVSIVATATAKAETGPDLGGRHMRPLVPPRVGILTGYPVSPTTYGALWHLLDEEVGVRFSGLPVERLPRTDLRRYNVLVVPSCLGGRRGCERAVGAEQLARLGRWVAEGGTLIGLGAGAELLAGAESGLTATRLRRQALDTHPPVVLGPPAAVAEQAGLPRASGLRARERDPADGAADPYDVAPIVGSGARPFVEGRHPVASGDAAPTPLAEWLSPVLPEGREKPAAEDLERADARLRRFAPRGAFLRVELDPQHWIAWGAGEEVPALVRGSAAFVADDPARVVAWFAAPETLHLGGLLWPEAAGRLARTAYAVREQKERGQVILFLGEPAFRGWTLGTRRLLVNALLLGPGLGTRWSAPW